MKRVPAYITETHMEFVEPTDVRCGDYCVWCGYCIHCLVEVHNNIRHTHYLKFTKQKWEERTRGTQDAAT